MLPHEVMSSRGHQLLALHEPTSSDSSEQLDSEADIKDITHNLPDLSPLWQNNRMTWSGDYRPDLDSFIPGDSNLLDEVFTQEFADTREMADLHLPDINSNHLQ